MSLAGFVCRLIVLFIMLLSGALITSCADSTPAPSEVFTLDGKTMGTSWRLLWVDDALLESRRKPDAVKNAISAELGRINALMSTWDPDSELSEFNASQSIEPVALHADTLEVIDAALSISRLTNGSYDITLQPVIRLWSFSDNAAGESVPTDQKIRAALDVSGYRQLVRVNDTIRKRLPELAIDVSSIAKGYAVDKLGEVVEALGIDHYLVDIGGEIRTRGERSKDKPWRVGVESPEGEVPQVIILRDAHVASSGSYRNYRMVDGKRLSHIIDGATGRPVEHALVAVSVVHSNTMLADAWATALLVVGETRATKLIDEQGLVAQLTVVNGGQFRQISSPDFTAMLIED